MNKPMSLENAVEAFDGFMVLWSLLLTYVVNPQFVWLTLFVGVNLLQQSFTGMCPPASVLRRLFGLKSSEELAHRSA